MKKYGLLGRKLLHSLSPEIHRELGNNRYDLFQLEPDKLYHVTSEKNLDNILKKGISSACGVVFLTDSFQDLEDYLEWKQVHRKNWDRIFLLTINTKLCREQGIGICKINRDREFIAQGVPPEAIVACWNFQKQLASNRHGN